ncbi:hypothetical protein [Desulfatitalea tepidiphila]|uniref:hypothetical protein n=1 Tax=Desulfatitalea tepidiphila TaxID=1185843 RepID=UPI0006B62A5C|nr:hypothetical protein [Desulfatitalea tepidiphila]
MTRYFISITAIALLGCAALSACGTTGVTSHFTLRLDLPRDGKVAADVHVASAAMAEDAAFLNVVRVQPWGRFGPDDLRNIEQSLRDTIAPHLAETLRPGDVKIDLHLVVRRYVVSISNTAGAVIACVVWAATTPKGSVIYEEQFYASDAAYLVTTIGLIKDSVHKAIVRRIATTALAIAQDSAANIQSIKFDKTSTSFEESAARLPKTMVSLGDPSLMVFPELALGVVGLLTPSGVSTVEWRVADPSGAFDWTGYLNKLYGP